MISHNDDGGKYNDGTSIFILFVSNSVTALSVEAVHYTAQHVEYGVYPVVFCMDWHQMNMYHVALYRIE